MIKHDKRNYRLHSEQNKAIIKKSLEELGAGRSILLDKNDEIVAGNGVYEQAKKIGLKVRVVETDGKELVCVKRMDLKTQDDKRKKLAIMDNSASDTSEFDFDLLRKDFGVEEVAELGVDMASIAQSFENQNTPTEFSEEERQALPVELQTGDISPDEIQKIESDYKTEFERVIITFPFDRQGDLERLLGVPLNKIFYDFDEILKMRDKK